MSFKDKIENFAYTQKLNGNRVSSMNFIRENFDECQKLIMMMKNQGQGSAYEKIAEICFDEGIKTKKGEKLSTEYINDCLIKIRKEKGIKTKHKRRVKAPLRQMIELTDDVNLTLEFGMRSVKKHFSEILKDFKPSPRKMNLSQDGIKAIGIVLNKYITNYNEFDLKHFNADEKIDIYYANDVKAFLNYHSNLFNLK